MSNVDGAEIRPAAPQDSHAISVLLREAFGPWVAERTIYGCRGIDRYLTAVIAGGALTSTRYLVADSGGGLAGCAELRRNQGNLFLGYIAVTKEASGRGVGTRLLRGALELLGWSPAAEMTLDVFDDNELAASWYERLGFEERELFGWWEGDLPAGQGEEPAAISGLAESSVCQRAHGFSQLRVDGPTGSYQLGRLGDQWWRVTNLRALGDASVVEAARHLDPNRRVLAFAPTGGPLAHGLGPVVRRSRRMVMSLSSLANRLSV